MPEGQSKAVASHFRWLAGARMLDESSDAQLLERFAVAGEEDAFVAIVQRHGPLVLGVCRRVLANGHDAEDAFQATFLVLAEKATSIRRSESLSSWLYGVALRVASRAKGDSAKRRHHERSAGEVRSEPEESTWDEVGPIVDSEIQGLPTKYRQAVVLRYLQGLSSSQAARTLNCPEGTLTWRLSRALEMLRHRLHRRGVLLSAAGLLAGLAGSAVATPPPALAEATLHAVLAQLTEETLVGVSSSILDLRNGALHAMWMTKMKSVGAILLGVLALVGVVGLGFAHSAKRDESPSSQRRKAAPVPAKLRGDLELLFEVNQNKVVLDPSGRLPDEFEAVFALKNTSGKPLKLNTYDFVLSQLAFTIVDQEGKKRHIPRGSVKVKRSVLAPTEEDFPTVADGAIVNPRWKRLAGMMATVVWSIRKPGTYRIIAHYNPQEYSKERGLQVPWAEGSWQGTIASKPITLVVRERVAVGPEVQGLQARVALGHVGYTVGKPIPFLFTIKNLSKQEQTVWHSGFWPNHLVLVKDSEGREPPLTEFGKLTRRAFTPGGPRTKNVPVQLQPGAEDKVGAELTKLFDLSKPGRYTVQVIYEEKIGGWEGRLPSGVLAFDIVKPLERRR